MLEWFFEEYFIFFWYGYLEGDKWGMEGCEGVNDVEDIVGFKVIDC